MLYRDIDKCLDTLMWHLKGPFHRWRDRQLREEIRNMLLLFERTSNLGPDSIPYTTFKKNSNISLPYFPTGPGDGRAIAIGRFNQAGAPIRGDTTRLPRGYVSFSASFPHHLITLKQVERRFVCNDADYGGVFREVGWESIQSIPSNASATLGVPSFFCLYRPYFYLQAWIDCDSLPPRQIAFPLEPDMSFEGEFYEIINTHQKNRSMLSFLFLTPVNSYSLVGENGTLPWIDYEGIDLTHTEMYQKFFEDRVKDAFHLRRALKSGLRGNDLVPALLDDFHVWQTCPPDRYAFRLRAEIVTEYSIIDGLVQLCLTHRHRTMSFTTYQKFKSWGIDSQQR
jgi:hypothetical protein